MLENNVATNSHEMKNDDLLSCWNHLKILKDEFAFQSFPDTGLAQVIEIIFYGRQQFLYHG